MRTPIETRTITHQLGIRPFVRYRTPLAVYLAALTLTIAMNDTRRIGRLDAKDVIQR